MKIVKSSQKKEIIQKLNQQFGIKEFPYLILKFGKEKYRAYSGNLSKEELLILDENLRVETAGMYFLKEQGDGLRLTFDGVFLFKNQISKNILEISDEQAEEWLRGNELLIKSDKNFKIIKNKSEFLGCGKSTGEKISNFVPKERRIK